MNPKTKATLQLSLGLRATIAGVCAFLVAACAQAPSTPPPVFEHTLTGDPYPWTSKPFDAPPERFRFAIHSDLTGGERDGIYEIAIAQLNLLRPEFIISVGDLIEGDEVRAEIDRQWDHFDRRTNKARAPVFYVGGNHDLLGGTHRTAWEERLGQRYYHFLYKNALFLVFDTDDHSDDQLMEIASLRESALQVAKEAGWDAFAQTPYANLREDDSGVLSPAQQNYFLNVVEAYPEVRWTFLFMHKAPWVHDDLTGFSAIETALSGRNYTVFHGHRHAYQHERRNGADYIRLATTGGVHLPENGRSMDQLTLVTVDEEGVDIANLLMEGILNSRGDVPLDGNDQCFESTRCPESP